MLSKVRARSESPPISSALREAQPEIINIKRNKIVDLNATAHPCV